MARTRGGLSRGKGRVEGRGGGRRGDQGAGRGTVGEEPVQGQSQILLSPELIAMINQVVTTVLAQRAAEEAPRVVESSGESVVLDGDANKRKDFGESSSAKESGRADPKRQNRGKAHGVEKVGGKGYMGELPKCLSCKMHHPAGDRCIECRNCKKVGHIAKFCKESGVCVGCGSLEHFRDACPQWIGQQFLVAIHPNQQQTADSNQTEETGVKEEESM